MGAKDQQLDKGSGKEEKKKVGARRKNFLALVEQKLGQRGSSRGRGGCRQQSRGGGNRAENHHRAVSPWPISYSYADEGERFGRGPPELLGEKNGEERIAERGREPNNGKNSL